MKYKINDKLEIELKEFKSYAVSKAVKLALLDWVIVTDGKAPEVPASNAIKSEEALILGMSNLKQDQLESLRESEYDLLLIKINEIAGSVVPTIDSWDK